MAKKSKNKHHDFRSNLFKNFIKFPVWVYLKLQFNIKEGQNDIKKVKEPFLMLGHHVTVFDPIIINLYSKKLIHFVASDLNYESKIKKVLLNWVSGIPLTKNNADIRTIKKLSKSVKRRNPVGLYPEGGRNWDGQTDEIIYSTAKLVKFLKIPVYVSYFKGGYLSKPRWSKTFRKGIMEVDIKLAFTSDELKKMSEDQIYEKLKEKLSYNEFDWQRVNMIPFKGKNLAEGIERLVYLCPNCGALCSFVSGGDHFNCKECNIEYKMNKYGFIEGCTEFDNTAEWNTWQRNKISEIIEKGFNLELNDIFLKRYDKDNIIDFEGHVNVRYDNKGLFITYPNGSDEHLLVSEIYGESITLQGIADIYSNKTRYRLSFEYQKHFSVCFYIDSIRGIKRGG